MSAWAKIQKIEEPINFHEITSEQLARSLHKKEVKKHKIRNVEEVLDFPEVLDILENDQTDNDAAIAFMMQLDLNEEYNLMLKNTEKKFNRDSKVNVSYTNYRADVYETDEPKIDIDDEKRDFDRFVSIEKEYASIPRCGYKKIEDGGSSQIVTKHDMLMSSRINACRVLEFPPGIKTGDTGGFDVKLNNKVFNSLRQHSYAHCSRQKAKAHSKPQPKAQSTSKIAS